MNHGNGGLKSVMSDGNRLRKSSKSILIHVKESYKGRCRIVCYGLEGKISVKAVGISRLKIFY